MLLIFILLRMATTCICPIFLLILVLFSTAVRTQEVVEEVAVTSEPGRPSSNAIRACGDDLYGYVAAVCQSQYWKRGGHPHSFEDEQEEEEESDGPNERYNDMSSSDSQVWNPRQHFIPRFRQHSSFDSKKEYDVHGSSKVGYSMPPSRYLSMSRLIPGFKPHPEVIRFHRVVRGIVDECCHKPCTRNQLKLYCGRRRRSTN